MDDRGTVKRNGREIAMVRSYLADIDEQATEMMFRLVEQMADKEGVTEQLKTCLLYTSRCV